MSGKVISTTKIVSGSYQQKQTKKTVEKVSDINIYCEVCGYQPMIIELLIADELNPDLAWGDILCSQCHLVIATVSTDLGKQGKYDFVKVEEDDRNKPS